MPLGSHPCIADIVGHEDQYTQTNKEAATHSTESIIVVRRLNAYALRKGQSIRTLNMIDKSNQVALIIIIEFSLNSARVIRVLGQIEEIYGLPDAIRVDAGAELRTTVFTKWCESEGTKLTFSQESLG